MRIVYIAADGKEFDNKLECEHYEWMQNHPYLSDIQCYGKDGKLYENIMADDTYNYCQAVIVPMDECAEELSDLAEYAGYYDYSYITEAGIWIYERNGAEGRFVKAGD